MFVCVLFSDAFYMWYLDETGGFFSDPSTKFCIFSAILRWNSVIFRWSLFFLPAILWWLFFYDLCQIPIFFVTFCTIFLFFHDTLAKFTFYPSHYVFSLFSTCFDETEFFQDSLKKIAFSFRDLLANFAIFPTRSFCEINDSFLRAIIFFGDFDKICDILPW